MSSNIVPSSVGSAAVTRSDGYAPLAQWGGPPTPQQESGGGLGDQISRSIAAIRRYKWLIVAIVAVGSAAGAVVTRFIQPMYVVESKVWIQEKSDLKGPVQAPGLIRSDAAWVELARSFSVLDKVVAKLGLNVIPAEPKDSAVVASIVPSEQLESGRYRLEIDAAGAKFTLRRLHEEGGTLSRVVETGAVGDSIGRPVGILWHPDPAQLGRGRAFEFDVMSAREGSLMMMQNLQVALPLMSNALRFQLTGPNPAMMTRTVNTLASEFTAEANRLKKMSLEISSSTVEEQLKVAASQLSAAQAAYESFKVNTITQPTENMAIPAGISAAMNPVFAQFFSDKTALEQARRDREALERIISAATSNGGKISIEALRGFPSVMGANPQLSAAISEVDLAQQNTRKYELTLTDQHPTLKAERERLARLETQTVPQLIQSSLAELKSRESEMQRRVDGASIEMKKIPARTIQEMQLKRDVDIASSVYADLANRAVAARLAERSALSDVSVLDTAVVPILPTKDTTLNILLIALGASIAAGLGLALLLDRLDKRFRYPEQATMELGLDIVGAIPTYRTPRAAAAKLEQATQLVEAFRTIALSVRNAFEGMGPIQLTISSPGPGDGKSFTSANLASALADSGFRTVLIDGDIRRGELHAVFGDLEQTPGLLDYLAGESTLEQVVRPTQHHANLFVVPGGRRRKHGPELLASERMRELLDDLRSRFDAILVDSAPLGAGIDPFALGSATGSMLIVLRAGETDRKLAQAKLSILDRMPVRIIGAILNDVGVMPQFKYYYYLEGYHGIDAPEAAETALLGAGGRGRA